jgi:hypothetical protein
MIFSHACVWLQPVAAHPFGDVIHADDADDRMLLQLVGCRRAAVAGDLQVVSKDARLQAMSFDYIRQVDGVEQEKDWPENRSLRHTEFDPGTGQTTTAKANVLCSVGQVVITIEAHCTLHSRVSLREG